MEIKMRVNEAAIYLKHNKGYKRILEAILKKYKSLGKLGGFIMLEGLSDEEVKILYPLDYKVRKAGNCKISIKKFTEYFCAGKFENIDFEEVLRVYSGERLISNTEARQNESRQAALFYKELGNLLISELVRKWVYEAIETKKYGYHSINKLYKQSEEYLREVICAIDRVENHLRQNKKWILLPVLASQVTSDSHYFDLNNTGGKLLVYFLAYKFGQEYPQSLQEMNALLAESKIFRDEVSNTTLCYGIYGKSLNEEKPWGEFWKLGEPLQLSIFNLKDVLEIKALNNKVYIVENPAVFSRLLESAIQKGVGLICTSGQVNTSSYMLLDLLEASATEMYYNGDFDPEGLQIADKLKQKYVNLNLWHYEVEDYLRVKGNVNIEDRLSKLNSIAAKELKALIAIMKKEKVAGYQELLVKSLMEDIQA